MIQVKFCGLDASQWVFLGRTLRVTGSCSYFETSILVPRTHGFQSGVWPRTTCGSFSLIRALFLLDSQEDNSPYHGTLECICITNEIRRQKNYKGIAPCGDAFLVVLPIGASCPDCEQLSLRTTATSFEGCSCRDKMPGFLRPISCTLREKMAA